MKLLALVLALGLARADPPAPTDSAATARWMVSTLEFGALTTLSTRTDASTVGDPFGNPYSFADVGGVPYFYVSGLDASIVDTLGDEGANPSASLTLSERASRPAPARPARSPRRRHRRVDYDDPRTRRARGSC